MDGTSQEILGHQRLVLHDQRHDEHEYVERIEQLQLDRPLAGLLVAMLGDQLVNLADEQLGSGEQIETNANAAIETLVASHQIEGDHAQVVVEPLVRTLRVLAIRP